MVPVVDWKRRKVLVTPGVLLERNLRRLGNATPHGDVGAVGKLDLEEEHENHQIDHCA